MSSITALDVETLSREPSVEVRQTLAIKIAAGYRSNNFTENEANIAVEIFRILMKDIEVKIRKSLAEQLAHCPKAPRDVMLRLANDETEVALPVLEHSSVLTEDDLVTIVQSTKEILKLCAITHRQTLSETVSDSLMELHNATVFGHLFKNKGAAIGEQQLLKSWDAVSATPSLLETLVGRGGLPLTIVEKMFHAVSDELKQTLATKYKLNKPFMHKAVNDVREWELLGLTTESSKIDPRDEELVEDFVDDLYLNGRLTHSLLMRALCVGNLSVFEAGIARLAAVPRINARILLMESSGKGLEAIYRAAAMPEGFLDAVRVLLRISLEETEFGRTRSNDFRKRVIERIFIGRYNRTVENMEYILSIIGGRIIAGAHA